MSRGVLGRPIAHTHPDGRTHDLREHLEGTGTAAGRFAAAFGSEEAARLAGLWHDLGKYSEPFQAKLQGARDSQLNDEDTEAQRAASQRVDHSTAGAVLAARLNNRLSTALAFAIAGHHAGLADESALKERLLQKWSLLDDAIGAGVPEDLLALKLTQSPSLLAGAADRDDAERRLEFWTRMIFSALCDADFLDTEAFMDAGRARQRARSVSLDELAVTLRDHLDALEAQAPASEVNRVRAAVRAACVERAKERPGRFTLTVPTGGGKTLAAMAFALEHARTHGLDRVIVAVPYTAILEQNAAVYRKVFERFGEDAIVEQHSALDPDRETYRNKLAAENWDAPIVVTTTVQLFESLFARRPSRCRKLHRIARSVIVLDEAQTLPARLLPAILDALGTLTDHYGATLVSCTATQPALDHHPRHLPCGLHGMREIVPSDLGAFERLRRVDIDMPRPDTSPVTWEALAEGLGAHADVLAIVHRRQDARELCEALDATLGDTSAVHLSALQCPAHRSVLLDAVQVRKKRAEPVRVVATQLVEAGVDIDFAVVYRALAGFDALAQAAGRCNREGQLPGRGSMHVFVAPTKPPPGILEDGLRVARSLLDASPDVDVLSPEAQRRFFQYLYKNVQAAKDIAGVQSARASLMFEETEKRFKMIDDDWAAPVVVPWGEGRALIETALTLPKEEGLSRKTLRRMQRYTVSVPRALHDKLVARSILQRVEDTITVLPLHLSHVYDARFGLQLDRLAEGVADISTLIVG